MRRLVLLVPIVAAIGGLTLTWAGVSSGNDPAAAEPAAAMAASESGTGAGTATPDPACDVAASDARDITRVSGPDRFATAACASGSGYPDGAATVVLARGDAAGGYADALAGTVLAHHVQGPILLTAPDELPTVTADEIE
ncbi:MAG TPA: cell wall-binding repeat-containing protein, partial [Nitriliruptorales bacterium]